MNLSLSGSQLLVALGMLLLPLLLLVALLLVVLWRMHHKLVSSLRAQNRDLWEKTQSLLNQLRASDLPSLVTLQSLTTQDSQSEEYVPSWDENPVYQQAMEESGNYVTEGIPNEFDAAGWEPVVRAANTGSSPVRFDG